VSEPSTAHVQRLKIRRFGVALEMGVGRMVGVGSDSQGDRTKSRFQHPIGQALADAQMLRRKEERPCERATLCMKMATTALPECVLEDDYDKELASEGRREADVTSLERDMAMYARSASAELLTPRLQTIQI
jgi:hypothetical protein